MRQLDDPADRSAQLGEISGDDRAAAGPGMHHAWLRPSVSLRLTLSG
ncbi:MULTISPECIES: hypothetical protein [unclassified Micromonospora]